MSKKTIGIFISIVGIGAGALFFLDSYRVELIHSIVANAVIQKAPQEYPQNKIREVFDEALHESRRLGREEVHLARLLKLSQRLEKIQSLSAGQIEELLASLTAGQSEP